MKANERHLNDEHMRLYEWNGLGTPVAVALPERSKRTHAWHASYGVLAVLTSLLILNGCDRQRAAEQASEQIGQAVQEPPEPLYDSSSAPADAAAPASEDGAATAPGVSEPATEQAAEPAAPAAGAPQQP
jgi:cytoskeletal protein RodZ